MEREVTVTTLDVKEVDDDDDDDDESDKTGLWGLLGLLGLAGLAGLARRSVTTRTPRGRSAATPRRAASTAAPRTGGTGTRHRGHQPLTLAIARPVPWGEGAGLVCRARCNPCTAGQTVGMTQTLFRDLTPGWFATTPRTSTPGAARVLAGRGPP